jgi:hypothetical protein
MYLKRRAKEVLTTRFTVFRRTFIFEGGKMARFVIAIRSCRARDEKINEKHEKLSHF